MLQEGESTPVAGFTETETSAALTPRKHNVQSKMALMIGEAIFELVFPDEALLLSLIGAEHR